MNKILFIIGFISILGQIVLLRELAVVFYGIELIYLLALGFWLLWTGLGALIGRGRGLPSISRIRLLLILYGFLLPLDLVFIRGIRLIFGGVPGAFLSFPMQMAAMLIALLPIGLLLGALFGWTARRYVASGGTLAKAYAIESAGGVVGGVASTLFLIVGLQNLQMGFICGLTSIIILPFSVMQTAKILRLTSILIILIYAVLFWQSLDIDEATTRWNHPNLVISKDSPYGRITLTEVKGQIALFENDALAYETEGITAERFVHLTAIQHANPERVLVLGGGIEGTIHELLKHSPSELDYVELNKKEFNLTVSKLPDDIRTSFLKDGVNIIFMDPRRFLAETVMSYDLILIGMPEPGSGQTNRFYTREFYALCAERLNVGGIIGLRLRSAENFWTPLLIRRTASIYRAIKSAFNDVVILPGTTNIVIASDRILVRSPEILSERFELRGIKARLVNSKYIHYLYTNDRFLQIVEKLEIESAPMNSDTRPVCYQYAIALWLSKFYQPFASLKLPEFNVDDLKSVSYKWLILVIIPLSFLFLRLRRRTLRIVLVGIAGFIGMVIESVMILYYQTRCGVLYQDIGLLVTAFMAGLASGAWIIGYLVRGNVMPRRLVRWLAACMLIGYALLNGFLAFQMSSSGAVSLVGNSILLFITGSLTAGIFAHAGIYRVLNQQHVVAPLYASDLVGACLGALIGSLLLIPAGGLSVTAILMVYLSICAFLLLDY